MEQHKFCNMPSQYRKSLLWEKEKPTASMISLFRNSGKTELAYTMTAAGKPRGSTACCGEVMKECRGSFTKGCKALQKRYLPIAVLTGVLAVVAVAGYLLPEPHETVPRRILLDNAGGAVVLQHADHAFEQKIPCQKCHHESPVKRENVQRCESCHGVTFDAAFRKNHVAAFNDNASCATCHHYELASKKWGHKKHQEEYGLDCRECHHKNTDIEPEPQNCADCHESGAPPTNKKPEEGVPPNLADAVHARCVTCHEDMFAAKAKGCAQCHSQKAVRHMLPKEGLVRLNPMFTNCAVCHGLPAEKLIPGRMDAYHKQCMGCHEKEKKGPFGKEQCAQCHTGK